MAFPNVPESLLDTTVDLQAGTRTYKGKDCALEHGGIRYKANGMCIQCCKIHRRDRQTVRREKVAALPMKQPAYRMGIVNAQLDRVLLMLQEAGKALLEAKGVCPRGEWFRGLRARGLDKRLASHVRRLGEGAIKKLDKPDWL